MVAWCASPATRNQIHPAEMQAPDHVDFTTGDNGVGLRCPYSPTRSAPTFYRKHAAVISPLPVGESEHAPGLHDTGGWIIKSEQKGETAKRHFPFTASPSHPGSAWSTVGGAGRAHPLPVPPRRPEHLVHAVRLKSPDQTRKLAAPVGSCKNISRTRRVEKKIYVGRTPGKTRISMFMILPCPRAECNTAVELLCPEARTTCRQRRSISMQWLAVT